VRNQTSAQPDNEFFGTVADMLHHKTAALFKGSTGGPRIIERGFVSDPTELQSNLTRAVFFSALMTATAFGSLMFSSNPGIASIGKLLALSLACTLASAALFQPSLMGPPRHAKAGVP
jgi:hypothetical protein